MTATAFPRIAALALALLAAPAAAQQGAMLNRLIADADRDGDGRITEAEFRAARDRTFPVLDRDRNGGLDQGELAAMSPPGMPPFAMRMGFARFDGNGDGAISPAELSAGPVRAFTEADRNGDGVLDAGEIAAFRARAASPR